MKKLDKQEWEKYLKEFLAHYGGPIFGEADIKNQKMTVTETGYLNEPEMENNFNVTDSNNSTCYELYDESKKCTFKSNPIDFLLNFDNGMQYNSTKNETLNYYSDLWIETIVIMQNYITSYSDFIPDSFLKETQEYNWLFMNNCHEYCLKDGEQKYYERKYEYCKQQAEIWSNRYKELTGEAYNYFNVKSSYQISQEELNTIEKIGMMNFESCNALNFDYDYYNGLPLHICGFTMFVGDFCYTIEWNGKTLYIPVNIPKNAREMDSPATLKIIQHLKY